MVFSYFLLLIRNAKKLLRGGTVAETWSNVVGVALESHIDHWNVLIVVEKDGVATRA